MLQYSSTPNPDQVTRGQLYLIMIIYLLFGSSITIILKIQNTTETVIDGQIVYWQHPFVQTGFMFLGEMLCGVVYYFKYKKEMDTDYTYAHSEKAKLNPLWVAIPAFLDMTGSFMVFFGLTQIQASIYQMIRGFVVVYSALLTYAVFKRNQMFHHYIGIFLVVLGVFLVGTTSYFDESSQSKNGNFIMGFCFVVLGQFFQACHIVSQEIFIRKVYCHQFQLTGWEGIWGTVFQLILFPIFQNVSCNLEFCSNGKIEDYYHAYMLLNENYLLVVLAIIYIIVIAFYNALSVTITKYASAVHQCTVDQARVFFVWSFFLLYPGLANEQFRMIQFIGFIIIITGNFIFNELIGQSCLNSEARIKNEISNDFKESLIDKRNTLN